LWQGVEEPSWGLRGVGGQSGTGPYTVSGVGAMPIHGRIINQKTRSFGVRPFPNNPLKKGEGVGTSQGKFCTRGKTTRNKLTGNIGCLWFCQGAVWARGGWPYSKQKGPSGGQNRKTPIVTLQPKQIPNFTAAMFQKKKSFKHLKGGDHAGNRGKGVPWS